jgi:hypothetical protein
MERDLEAYIGSAIRTWAYGRRAYKVIIVPVTAL